MKRLSLLFGVLMIVSNCGGYVATGGYVSTYDPGPDYVYETTYSEAAPYPVYVEGNWRYYRTLPRGYVLRGGAYYPYNYRGTYYTVPARTYYAPRPGYVTPGAPHSVPGPVYTAPVYQPAPPPRTYVAPPAPGSVITPGAPHSVVVAPPAPAYQPAPPPRTYVAPPAPGSVVTPGAPHSVPAPVYQPAPPPRTYVAPPARRVITPGAPHR